MWKQYKSPGLHYGDWRYFPDPDDETAATAFVIRLGDQWCAIGCGYTGNLPGAMQAALSAIES